MRRYKSILIAVILLIIPFARTLSQGYLHTSGKYIYDGNNNEVILRGIGTGNWFINEGYMMKTEDFAGTHTQLRDLITETIGEQNTEAYYEQWLNNQFTRRDVDSMNTWGFNSVRVAMHYKWFTLPIEKEPVTGQDTWLEEGFVRIDSLLDWCGDNGMYLILDLHGAPGGQGHDSNISDYDTAYPSLWESAENRRKTVALWKKLAQRYAGEPWIGGYDVINEPNWEIPNGTLLKQTYVSITDAIRSVDQNHMIIVEGNWFANDYTGLTPPWDDNLVYSFHKYWSYNTQESIQWMINLRDTYNIPIWLGESGENSNSWFTDLVSLLENNKIGWSWWPVKKAGINNVLMVPESQSYNQLLSFWKTGSPSMSQAQAYYALLDWANNQRIENCTVQHDVIDALIRQPHSNQAIPFKLHQAGDVVNMTDYDLGKCSVAYWDTDTANYHLNTNVYVNWNEGWLYRNDGVDIEKCTDNDPGSNGFDVGWTKEGEWLQYTVVSDSLAAWQVIFRSACASNPGQVHLDVNGTDVSQPFQLPVTGGWQTWQSSTIEQVIIPAGTNKIRLHFDTGGSNVSYFKFLNPQPAGAVPFRFISGATSNDGATIFVTLNKPVTSMASPLSDFELKADETALQISSVIVNPGDNRKLIFFMADTVNFSRQIKISYSGNAIFSNEQQLEIFTDQPVKNNLPRRTVLPATIQAEDFDFNNGYQLETCSDVNGGQNLGYANNGDYVDYNIYIPEAGDYSFRFRVASLYSNGSISVRLGDGDSFTALKSVSFNATGGWQSWTTQSATIGLPKGSYRLRLYSLSGEYNINWFEISLPAGINEIPQLRHFRIFPNPVKGTLTIEAAFKEITPVNYLLSDICGNIILRRSVTDTMDFSEIIECRAYSPGIYFLHFSTTGGALTRKILIN